MFFTQGGKNVLLSQARSPGRDQRRPYNFDSALRSFEQQGQQVVRRMEVFYGRLPQEQHALFGNVGSLGRSGHRVRSAPLLNSPMAIWFQDSEAGFRKVRPHFFRT